MLGRRPPGAAHAEPGEVALVREAGADGDVADRLGRSGQPVDRPLQAEFPHVDPDRHALMAAERASELRRTHVERRRHVETVIRSMQWA